MHFHKYIYPANFEFVSNFDSNLGFRTRRGQYRLKIDRDGSDVFRLRVNGPGWQRDETLVPSHYTPLKTAAQSGSKAGITVTKRGSAILKGPDGRTLLRSLPGRFFGQCGEASVFEFVRHKGDRFYGLGEKWSGLEHTGKTTKFWNTDIWGDFNPESYIHGKPAADPTYVSVPYLIIKRRRTYIGLLLENPHATFVSTGLRVTIANQMEATPGGAEFAEALTEEIDAEESKLADGFIYLGAEEGQPTISILVGPSLPELTRKLQKLVGLTPLPPAWALGYHQCRWGYEDESDLKSLDRNFRKHDIPADGLWLDIDYMRGYRVFTFQKEGFPNAEKAFKQLAEKGREVVPIIDPGVKVDPGYDVYKRGKAAGAFCLNPQGQEYIGLVWPGETAFPDFSEADARDWWAEEVANFARTGIHGAWLDMNDPSTGLADNHQMLFGQGKRSHSTFHNQYALGMAMATREGFLQAHPDRRPFLLCRSGYTGTSRFTAIWTGDNYSNYHHLRNSIATSLNLALSGIPFNGPDAGGFGGDTTPELISDWFKAAFLFPVFRNHSLKDTRQQEPWAFEAGVMKVLRHYIRLRYRLRPYLYQLFIAQEETGEAILRPLFYDFEETRSQSLALVDDQFMVGPSILQAPFVDEVTARRVTLPGRDAWYYPSEGHWIAAGRTITVQREKNGTPLYVRDGSILPLARLAPADHVFRGDEVDFHIFLKSKSRASLHYAFDDGATFAYQSGARSMAKVDALRKGRTLIIKTQLVQKGHGEGKFTFTTDPKVTAVTINGRPARRCEAQGEVFATGWKTWSA